MILVRRSWHTSKILTTIAAAVYKSYLEVAKFIHDFKLPVTWKCLQLRNI